MSTAINMHEYYRRARAIRPYVYWCITVLLASIVIGAYSPILFPDVGKTLLASSQQFAHTILERPDWQIFLFVFLNNSVKAFAIVLLGAAAGVVPVVFLAVNGYLVGLVSVFIAKQSGVTAVLIGLVPHGVFEIPAMIIAASLGMLIGSRTVQKLWGERAYRLGHEYVQSLRFFLVVALPLFLIAALVEVYVTPCFLEQSDAGPQCVIEMSS